MVIKLSSINFASNSITIKQKMHTYPAYISLKIEEPVFLKDPILSELGIKIISEGIFLMKEQGYEDFTFKKLAKKIESTEASVYRYFENKHKLLSYYFVYYWHYTEHRIAFATANVKNPETRLKSILQILAEDPPSSENQIIDLVTLRKVIIDEFPKVYLNKAVDKENSQGVFKVYKRVCKTMTDILQEIEPDYTWSTPLISTVMEAIYFQQFYAGHLPSLTHKWKSDKELAQFFFNLITKTVKSDKK